MRYFLKKKCKKSPRDPRWPPAAASRSPRDLTYTYCTAAKRSIFFAHKNQFWSAKVWSILVPPLFMLVTVHFNCSDGISNTKKRSIHASLRNVSLTQKLDYIFFKIKSVPTTPMTSNFLSLPGQEMHSIFQHWEPLTSKPSNQHSMSGRKNLSIPYKFPTR